MGPLLNKVKVRKWINCMQLPTFKMGICSVSVNQIKVIDSALVFFALQLFLCIREIQTGALGWQQS